MNHKAVYRTAPATPGLLNMIPFCFCFLLLSIQRTGYSIQQTVKKEEKKGKSVEKVLKKYGKKCGIRGSENLVANLVDKLV